MLNARPARPYRSHKVPACKRCRQRKSRCTIELPGEACLLCRMYEIPCSSKVIRTALSGKKIFPRGNTQATGEKDGRESSSSSSLQYVAGPLIAQDTRILESVTGTEHGRSTNDVSGNVERPIYQQSVPERRPSPEPCGCSQNLPAELLRQVEPYLDELIQFYFERLYPAFPIVNRAFLTAELDKQRGKPGGLLTSFLAYILFYWKLASDLHPCARPDQDFAWSVATQVEKTELQHGSFASMVGIIFNVGGRPSKGFVTNMTNSARLVALSYSRGLNHDCHNWRTLGPQEKASRTKLWWAVLIHDIWLNFAQGTPPHIVSEHFDVPLPTTEMLADDKVYQEKHRRAVECYIELCELTKILSYVLPLIYRIRAGSDDEMADQIRKSRLALENWTLNKPDWIEYKSFKSRPDVPGLANLQFSYLATRLLLNRIAWYNATKSSSSDSANHLAICLEIVQDMSTFVLGLTVIDIRGFWLPYHSHHFTSAITVSLRCALQTGEPNIRACSMSAARTLFDTLRKLRDVFGWDMAEIALAQTEGNLTRVEKSLASGRDGMTAWETPVLSSNGLTTNWFEDLFGDFDATSDFIDFAA